MTCETKEKVKTRQYYQTREDVLKEMRWYVKRYIEVYGVKQ